MSRPDNNIRTIEIPLEETSNVIQITLPDNSHEEVFSISIDSFQHSGKKNAANQDYLNIVAQNRFVKELHNWTTTPLPPGNSQAGDVDFDLYGLSVEKFLDDEGDVNYVLDNTNMFSICIVASGCNGYANRFCGGTDVVAFIQKSPSNGYWLENSVPKGVTEKTNFLTLEFLHASTLTNRKSDVNVRPNRRIFFTEPYTMKVTFYVRPRNQAFRA